MKAFRLIGMALVAMCLCMNFASCSNEDVVSPEDPQEEKYVTVGLGCTGEFLEFSESPLSRNAQEELYGIQVYALVLQENTGIYEEVPYAYGLFTTLKDVQLRLLEGVKYTIRASIIIDADTSSLWFGKNYETFNSAYGVEFNYSSTEELTITKTFKYNVDRYFGELNNYVPQANVSVDIDTKRVVYGVKYEIKDLADGESLDIEVNRMNDTKLYSVKLDSKIHEGVYTFDAIWNAWRGNKVTNETTGEIEYKNYTNNKKLVISWKKADGKIVPMGKYEVTFKRNVMTTIKINAENLNMDNGIKVFKEETSMVPDENIYEINGGTVTEVPVVPGN